MPLTSLQEIKYPFLQMGLGFNTTVNGKRYMFSFAKFDAPVPALDGEVADQKLWLSDFGRIAEAVNSLWNPNSDKGKVKNCGRIF